MSESKLRNFRASKDLWEKLKKEAKKQDKSASQLLRDICVEYLKSK